MGMLTASDPGGSASPMLLLRTMATLAEKNSGRTMTNSKNNTTKTEIILTRNLPNALIMPSYLSSL
jgi:hypothetical protein